MKKVIFDLCEFDMALAVARWRTFRIRNDKLGVGHGEGPQPYEQELKRHIYGALSEMAVAKDMNMYWGGNSENWQGNDIAGYEVRSTNRSSGHCIVFDKDSNDKNVLLVTIDIVRARKPMCICTIVGSILAKDAKNIKYLKPIEELRAGSQKQYWIPQSDLNPY